MEKIIVFTSRGSLKIISQQFFNRKDIEGLSSKSPILYYREELDAFQQTDSLDAAGLYLIDDLIKKEIYDRLISSINKNDLYILKHSEPTHLSFDDISEKNILTGKHTKSDPYYTGVVEILMNSDSKKVTKIFEKVFSIDHQEEGMNEAIFKLIYAGESEDKVLEAIRERDQYIFNKRSV